jgi:hypothetical protein
MLFGGELNAYWYSALNACDPHHYAPAHSLVPEKCSRLDACSHQDQGK